MSHKLPKKSFFLQNCVVKMITGIHPSIMHNLGKIEMLKKAMWHLELEQISGDYFEFGVYEGTSLYTAVKARRAIGSKIERKFFGFDSFDQGFKYFDNRDQHPFFKEGDFVSSYEKVKRRFKKFPEVHLIKGYFEDTVANRSPEQVCGAKQAGIVFIDCDLMNPALVALNFVKPMLQAGSIIILDDYWAYKGSEQLGTCGALNAFLAANPNIKVREYNRYGYGGTSFVVSAV